MLGQTKDEAADDRPGAVWVGVLVFEAGRNDGNMTLSRTRFCFCASLRCLEQGLFGKLDKTMKRTTKAKRYFALEDRLLSVLRRTVSTALAPQGCGVTRNFTKLQVGMVIPDLVVVASPQDIRVPTKHAKIPSLFECAVVAELLKCGPSTHGRVARKLFARPHSLERAVLRLKSLQLLRVNRRRRISANRRAFPASIKVISIEAKLRRWKDAILQAEEYLSFSDCAYVALPKIIINTNDRIKLACQAKGLGLIAVNSLSSEIILRPKTKRPLSAARVWLMRKAASMTGVRRIFRKREAFHGLPVAERKFSKALSHAA